MIPAKSAPAGFAASSTPESRPGWCRGAALGLPLVLLLALGACESAGNYPSLARRAAERVSGSADPVAAESEAPPPLPPASADLTTRVDALLAAARTAHSQFTARAGAAESAVSAGAGGATDSPAWISANVAIAGLSSARSGAVTALADLDELYAAARDAAPQTESPSALTIAGARTQVEGWVASEDATLSRLEGRIRR